MTRAADAGGVRVPGRLAGDVHPGVAGADDEYALAARVTSPTKVSSIALTCPAWKPSPAGCATDGNAADMRFCGGRVTVAATYDVP